MEALNAGSLGDLISTFTVSCVHADSLSKNEAMARAIDGLNQGNFDWETEVSLIGIDKPLKMAMNIPKVIVMPLAPIILVKRISKSTWIFHRTQSQRRQ